MLQYMRMGNKRIKIVWWFLIVITVITFLGGFVFILGSGLDSRNRARAAGAVGAVNGENVTLNEYQVALQEQRDMFKRQYGADPAEQDDKMLQMQAWRGLVSQKLLNRMALDLGLRPTNREVVLTLQTAPPNALASAPDFQTDGKFDPAKYGAALRNPNNNWAPFEALVRAQLPTRKLQERLLASLKLSEPELREAYRDRNERIAVTVVQVPPAQQPNVAPASPSDLDRLYEKYRGRFSAPERANLEVLAIPKKFRDEEVRAAHEQAQSLAERARHGEDFAQLAKDYSEGPSAALGGAMSRVFQPSDFGEALGSQMATLKRGGVSDPFQDGAQFVVLKLLDRVAGAAGADSGLKVAEILVRVRQGDDARREQTEAANKLRDRAASAGLGKAAVEKGLATGRTGYYDYNNTPQDLYDAPQAAEWGLNSKQGAVSPVYEGAQQFTIVQLIERRAAGPAPKEDLTEQLRQLGELGARVTLAKTRADAVAAALAQGASLENAAKVAGLTPMVIAGMTRYQPDPRLGQVPEVTGAAFGTPAGRIIGPIETLAGWYFVRVDRLTPADPAGFEQLKGQISNEILTRRQQTFFNNWLAELHTRSKIEDLRTLATN
jgi:peptidyl-prolyl cis-trans isomerase D